MEEFNPNAADPERYRNSLRTVQEYTRSGVSEGRAFALENHKQYNESIGDCRGIMGDVSNDNISITIAWGVHCGLPAGKLGTDEWREWLRMAAYTHKIGMQEELKDETIPGKEEKIVAWGMHFGISMNDAEKWREWAGVAKYMHRSGEQLAVSYLAHAGAYGFEPWEGRSTSSSRKKGLDF